MNNGITKEISGIIRVPRIISIKDFRKGKTIRTKAYAAKEPTTREITVTEDATINEFNKTTLNVLETSEVVDPGVKISM